MDSGCVPLEFASYDEGCQTMESGDLWGDEDEVGEAAPMPHVLPTLGREPGWSNAAAAGVAATAASSSCRCGNGDGDSDSDSVEECEEEEEESDHSENLGADEDWCLEQIENAYENLARAELGGANNSLSQYEMRQGLAEVRTVYRTLCSELGEAPRDGDGDGVSWEAKTTKQALLDYKGLVYPALRLRREREETVVKLCRQITELLSSLASGVNSPLFLEVMKVAEYDAEGHVGHGASASATATTDTCAAGDPQAKEKKAKKKKGAPGRGGSPSAVAVPRSLLPKDLSVVSVHSKSISLFRALLERMTEAKSKAKTTAPVDAASPAPPATDAATATAAACVASPRKRTAGETIADVVATAGCVKTLWDEDLLPVMKTLRITDTTWGKRMREVMVAGCQDDESDDESPLSAPAVLRAAKESLAAAVPLHAEVTSLLKSVSQEKATLECLVELRPQSRKRRRNPTERQANEALELARLKERVHSCATEALTKLRAFGCDTRGVPYVPPQILTTLVGLPSDEGGLVQYLQAVCEEAAPDGAETQPQQTPQQPSRPFGDCSASI